MNRILSFCIASDCGLVHDEGSNLKSIASALNSGAALPADVKSMIWSVIPSRDSDSIEDAIEAGECVSSVRVAAKDGISDSEVFASLQAALISEPEVSMDERLEIISWQ